MDTTSQFGELLKSALQIWRAFQISSPNFVTITLPKIVLTDWHQTPKQSMRFMGWWHQVSIWRAVQISSPILVTNRLLMNGPWQATDRPLMVSKTPQLIFNSSLWNPEGPQDSFNTTGGKHAQMYLQLPLRQRGASNVYLLVLSSWKPHWHNGFVDTFGPWTLA